MEYAAFTGLHDKSSANDCVTVVCHASSMNQPDHLPNTDFEAFFVARFAHLAFGLRLPHQWVPVHLKRFGGQSLEIFGRRRTLHSNESVG